MSNTYWYTYQGVEFKRDNEGHWYYRDKRCTKDMSKILEDAYEEMADKQSKYQAII